MLKKVIIFGFVAMLSSLTIGFAQQTFNYKGTVSNVKITMFLEPSYADYLTTYTGNYYYDNIGKNLSLRGFWNQRIDTIELVEVGDNDVITGFFSLKYDSQKGYALLTGTWTDLNRKRILPVRLTKID